MTKNQVSVLPDKILKYIQLYDTCKSESLNLFIKN